MRVIEPDRQLNTEVERHAIFAAGMTGRGQNCWPTVNDVTKWMVAYIIGLIYKHILESGITSYLRKT